MNKQSGFSLIELLLSIAIISVLTGLSVPLYETFVRRNDLDLTSQLVADTVRRAETYAKAVQGDSVWGVNFSSTAATIFKGASFASRDAAFDEVTPIPGSIVQSGLSEVTFSKMLATPSTAGTVTLTSNVNATKTITINAKGTVDY